MQVGVELADIFQRHGDEYRSCHKLSYHQRRVMRDIEDCRTAALGTNLQRCDHCQALQIRFCSCGNRHCPKCQTLAKERWVTARCNELLPTNYFHLVFTLPHQMNPLTQRQPRLVYNLLFRTVADTLLEFAHNPRWLGATPAVTLVLHTWGQNLSLHIHLHCIISGGGVRIDQAGWNTSKPGFLFPVRALSSVYRGKFLCGLRQLIRSDEIRLDEHHAQSLFATLRQNDWVVYAKRPFAGPEQVISYLGRYTHRVAITNQRILNMTNDKVRFRWRDYAHGNKIKTMTLPVDEFMRRFLLHVLPGGLMRIRHYGLSANRYKKERLTRARAYLNAEVPNIQPTESAADMVLRVTGIDIRCCPHCQIGRWQPIGTSHPPRRSMYSTGPP